MTDSRPSAVAPLALDQQSLVSLGWAVLSLACEAGALIKQMDPGCCGAREKPDRSPVSLADEAAEALIWAGLKALMPAMPILAEENCAKGGAGPVGRTFFVIDALDGTRDFLAGSGEYTVNVGLVVDGVPVLGAIVAPALNEAYLGVVGAGAWQGAAVAGGEGDFTGFLPVHARAAPADGLIAFVSRSHLDSPTTAFLASPKIRDRLGLGSSLKFARVAAGAGDVYPRLCSLMQWDVVAGHALVVAAGGVMHQPGGAALVYGADAPCERAQAFIAWGDPSAPSSFNA
ncbi:MAG: 3'(2'),5'-bisphosphate nucleotidase CysQ family protein [Caulobacterales bacterium]